MTMTTWDPAAGQFWASVSGGDFSECWQWIGFRTPKGYGLCSLVIDGKDTTRRAHRLAYEYLIGPIPDGLEIDHLCRNTGCVNPWHLEPVTKQVNIARSIEDRALRNTCKRGHWRTPENTRTYVRSRDGAQMRTCRICAAESALAR